MNRRPFLHALASGGALLSSGCVERLPFGSNPPKADAVFDDYRYEGAELVVEFSSDISIKQAVLYHSGTDEVFETIDHPRETARFRVVFPDRLETYVSKSLHVKAKTSGGWVNEWVWGPVHGAMHNVEVLQDGRARFDLENPGEAPLLVRFVAIYGDVPNPTVDPQSNSFDHSSFDLGPGVVGVGPNRPLSPSRTDLVVPPGETKPFETTYAPFAFPDTAEAADCSDTERSGTIALLRPSGGSYAYTFTYQLSGESAAVEGQAATVCTDTRK
jgi:hypothetical protein